MEIQEIQNSKKRYLDLLLIGDEQESMIDGYLNDGRLYVLKSESRVRAAFVLLDVGVDVMELKNIAVYPEFQKCGYGRNCIEFIKRKYAGKGIKLIAGTGEVPSTMGFYEHMGFSYSHRKKDFFTLNYGRPIMEDGITLKDMVYYSIEF